MRRLLLFSMVALLLVPAAASARAKTSGGVPLPPGAVKSDNLEYLGSFGGEGLVEGKFDRVHGRSVLITTGRFGFRIYDVGNPARPRLLDEFQPAMILDSSAAENPSDGYWQDEDMDIDTRRKLIIGALDPRHDNDDQESCEGVGTDPDPPILSKTRNPGCRSGFFVISYGNPHNLRQVGDFVDLPAGHTASCINNCDYIWTGGPARRTDLAYLGPFDEGGRGDGRPIWVTDLRNARKPKVFGNPIDLWRNDGATDYSHDVQVDERGIAWVSGRGGIRGYATKGTHRDPTSNLLREATPWDPILVAGGGVGGVNAPDSMFMHNSWRPTNDSVQAEGVEKGNILIGTEEEFIDDSCETDGRLVVSDLTDSWGGEQALNSTPDTPYRMKPLDTFHPAQDTSETAADSDECSAHYFELRKSTLAQAWYAQGLRLIDVSNARDIRQIGYYRVSTGDTATDSNSWDVAWRGNLVYLFDMNRGIEILRLKGGAAASARMRKVTAPSMKRPARFKAVSSLESGGLVCPLFE